MSLKQHAGNDLNNTFPNNFIIEIEGIKITVERKMIKTLRLSISGKDARIHLSAPLFLNDKDIKDFLLNKIEWIQTNKKKLKERIDKLTKHYLTGDNILFLGKTYQLQVINTERPPKISVDDENIYLYCRANYTEEQRKAVICRWYKRQLYVVLPPLITKWEQILNVKADDFQINGAQTLWGSCNIRTHRIHFSINLAKKTLRCIEYVVAHELTHLIERGHNKKFYSILDGHFEDAVALKLMLKKREDS